MCWCPTCTTAPTLAFGWYGVNWRNCETGGWLGQWSCFSCPLARLGCWSAIQITCHYCVVQKFADTSSRPFCLTKSAGPEPLREITGYSWLRYSIFSPPLSLTQPSWVPWQFPRRSHLLFTLEQERRMEQSFRSSYAGRRQGVFNGHSHYHARPSAHNWCKRGHIRDGLIF